MILICFFNQNRPEIGARAIDATNYWSVRMSTNPYTFIAVPRELRALSEELASLGGGDTRLGRVRVACLVGGDTPTRAVRKASPPSVWREELEETADQQDAECVCVRDRRRGASNATAAAHSVSTDGSETDAERFSVTHGAGPVHRFAVPATVDLNEADASERLWLRVGRAATDWVWDGFNATVVAYGHGSAARSRAVLGSDDGSRGVAVGGGGMIERALAHLYARIDGAEESTRYVVAISCWDLRGDAVVDLLSEHGGAAAEARSGRGGGGGAATADENAEQRRKNAARGYAQARRGARSGEGASGRRQPKHRAAVEAQRTVVEADGLDAACEIVRLARVRSSRCWGRDALRGGHTVDAHLFVRVLLHRGGVAAEIATHAAAARRSASLLLADLAPPRSSSRKKARAAPSAAARLAGRQLAAWRAVLSEITSAQKREATMRLSARDSELTRILVPHVIGNARTWLLPAVAVRPFSIAATLHILQVAAAADAAEITTACERTMDVVWGNVNVVRPGETAWLSRALRKLINVSVSAYAPPPEPRTRAPQATGQSRSSRSSARSRTRQGGDGRTVFSDELWIGTTTQQTRGSSLGYEETGTDGESVASFAEVFDESVDGGVASAFDTMPISPPRERERERSGRQHGSGASSVTSSVGERSVSDASVVNDSTAATAVELRQILISTNAEILAVQEHGGRPAKELTELVAIIEAALSATEAELAGEEEAAAAGATGAGVGPAAQRSSPRRSPVPSMSLDSIRHRGTAAANGGDDVAMDISINISDTMELELDSIDEIAMHSRDHQNVEDVEEGVSTVLAQLWDRHSALRTKRRVTAQHDPLSASGTDRAMGASHGGMRPLMRASTASAPIARTTATANAFQRSGAPVTQSERRRRIDALLTAASVPVVGIGSAATNEEDNLNERLAALGAVEEAYSGDIAPVDLGPFIYGAADLKRFQDALEARRARNAVGGADVGSTPVTTTEAELAARARAAGAPQPTLALSNARATSEPAPRLTALRSEMDRVMDVLLDATGAIDATTAAAVAMAVAGPEDSGCSDYVVNDLTSSHAVDAAVETVQTSAIETNRQWDSIAAPTWYDFGGGDSAEGEEEAEVDRGSGDFFGRRSSATRKKDANGDALEETAPDAAVPVDEMHAAVDATTAAVTAGVATAASAAASATEEIAEEVKVHPDPPIMLTPPKPLPQPRPAQKIESSAHSDLASTVTALQRRLAASKSDMLDYATEAQMRIDALTSQLTARDQRIAAQIQSREGAHALFLGFEDEARVLHKEATEARELSARLAQKLSLAEERLKSSEASASAAAAAAADAAAATTAAVTAGKAKAASAPTSLEALASLAAADDDDGIITTRGLGDAAQADFVDRDLREKARLVVRLRREKAGLEAEIAPLRLSARRFALHKRCLADAMGKVEKLDRVSNVTQRKLERATTSLAEVQARCARTEAALEEQTIARARAESTHESMELQIVELREVLRRTHRERHCDDLIRTITDRRRRIAHGGSDATGQSRGFESFESAPALGGRIPPATLPHAVERLLLELQRETSGPCLDPRRGTRLVGQLRIAMLRMDAQRRGCVAAEDDVIEHLVAFLEEDGSVALPRSQTGAEMGRQLTLRGDGRPSSLPLRLMQTAEVARTLRERSLGSFVAEARAEQRQRRLRGGI